MSLFDRLARHAAARPDQVALEWPGGRLDYAGLLQQVEAASQWLDRSAAGVIALDIDNGPAWVVLDIAAMHLGICVVPVPPFFSAQQTQHLLRHSGAGLVISDAAGPLRDRVGGLLQDDGLQLVVAGQCLQVLTAWAGRSTAAPRPDGPVHKITFTSGTTGQPKGVMLNWAQMRPVVTALVDAVGMTAQDRHLCLMPLAVLLENLGGVYVPLWAGGCVVLPPMRDAGHQTPAWEGATLAAALVDHRASTTIFSPRLLQLLVERLERQGGRPDTLRFAAVGGAAVAPRLLARAARLGLPVHEGYGLSECASVVCLNTPAAQRPGSVGRPLPHVRLRIDASGQVRVGAQPFVGYLGDPAPPDGDWPTGDLGEIDEDGFVHLHGRLRNVFITANGRNVSPEWVEGELTSEPAITQAVVFGEAQPYNVAVVVASAGASPQQIGQALEQANQRLPDYARVARWAVAEAPFTPQNGLLTANGRVRRDAIAAHYGPRIRSLYPEALTL